MAAEIIDIRREAATITLLNEHHLKIDFSRFILLKDEHFPESLLGMLLFAVYDDQYRDPHLANIQKASGYIALAAK